MCRHTVYMYEAAFLAFLKYNQIETIHYGVFVWLTYTVLIDKTEPFYSTYHRSFHKLAQMLKNKNFHEF